MVTQNCPGVVYRSVVVSHNVGLEYTNTTHTMHKGTGK